jgi:hypothetical protein
VSSARGAKRQRELARKEHEQRKQARKAARREQAAQPVEGEGVTEADQGRVLAELARLHERYEAGALEFDEFDELRAELTARLRVD